MTRDQIYNIILAALNRFTENVFLGKEAVAAAAADSAYGLLLASPQVHPPEVVAPESANITDAQGIHDRKCNVAAEECERLDERDLGMVAMFATATPEHLQTGKSMAEKVAIAADYGVALLAELRKRSKTQTKETK